MGKTNTKPEPLPTGLAGRITLVGTALYGKSWRRRLAAGLHISRSTPFEWLRDSHKRARDVEGDLIELLDVERDAANERGAEFAALRRRFIAIEKDA